MGERLTRRIARAIEQLAWRAICAMAPFVVTVILGVLFAKWLLLAP